MDKTKIITINGQAYNAQTGLPVGKVKKPAASSDSVKRSTPAEVVHAASLQKSQTLNRKAIKKPIMKHATQPLRTIKKTMDIARSSSISRFAPNPVMKSEKPAVKATPDIRATTHPIVAKTQTRTTKAAATTPATSKSSQVIKQEAIKEALSRPATKTPKKKGFFKRHPRLISISSAIIVLLLIGGYLTYINIPSLSVHVAAVQAGINATYPEYHPDGYSVSNVSFSDGQVVITFGANTGNSQFSITQSRSSWDSTAVKNMVDKASGSEFITSQEQGLTIYTYNGNAAWVNGGILYKIQNSGSTQLSGDQIRHIATSM